ncbi:YfhO family protein [Desulfococcaceae bacterium HSG9]|nr:YfhO family protein [Desulfococcaceae bacterium HSG9]
MNLLKSKWLQKSLPILFLLLLTIIFFYPVIFQGKTFYAFDTLLDFLPWLSYFHNFHAHNSLITDPVNVGYPFHHFFSTCLKQKILPLWNGANFCGMPHASGFVPQSNPIFIVTCIFFPLSIAHDILLWFHLFGIGLFMFLYLKKVGLKTCPSLIGAIAWMFNGYIMVWFEFENTPILACSLAASLYFIECWLKTRTRWHVICLTIAVALAVSSGFAHLIIYQILFIGIYLTYRLVLESKRTVSFQSLNRNDLLNFGIAVLFGIFISANFITTYLSFLDDPQRSVIAFDELFQKTGQLLPKYLATLIFPDFFGTPVENNMFTPHFEGMHPYNNYNELCIYTGTMTLLMVLVCIPFIFKKKYISFYLLTSLITLTMAMGSIIYYPMAKFIPGLSYSTPTRILYIFGFSMAVLAANGANLLTTSVKKKGWIISLLIILSGLVLWISFFVRTDIGLRWAANYQQWPNWEQVSPFFTNHFAPWSPVISKPVLLYFLSLLLLVLILLATKEKTKHVYLLCSLALLSYELISFGLKYNTASSKSLEYPATNAIRFLQKDQSLFRVASYGNFLHNSLGPFGIQDIGGYHSFYSKRYGEFLYLSQNAFTEELPHEISRWTFFHKFGSPLFDIINTKYILIAPNISLQIPNFNLIYNNEIKIYENQNAFPRFFFTPSYQLCENRKDAYQTIAQYQIADFREKVILESPPPLEFLPDGMKTGKNAKIKLIKYEPNSVKVEIITDHSGFLIMSDSYHPGWNAEIDGKETKVLRANYIMRAVPVKAGKHVISFTYFPKMQVIGIFMTVIGWLALLGCVGWHYGKICSERWGVFSSTGN